MTWLSTLGIELENHINVGPVSFWEVKKEPMRMTSTLAVTTLSARIERSPWRKCSENETQEHTVVTTIQLYIQTTKL